LPLLGIEPWFHGCPPCNQIKPPTLTAYIIELVSPLDVRSVRALQCFTQHSRSECNIN
jgi:hypothetical protein